MDRALVLAGVLAFVGGAGMASGLAAQEAPPSGVDAANGEGLVVEYPVFSPVETVKGYESAIDKGTRTEAGRPGDKYWQQQVDYTIDASLDPASAIVAGTETITVHNHSPGPIQGVIVHLYQNIFQEGVARNRAVQLTGGMNVSRVAMAGRTLSQLEGQRSLQGQIRSAEREGGYIVNGTIGFVLFPSPVPAGGTTELQMDWEFEVSGGGGMRSGHMNHEIFNVAQWYPQVAVYDDVFGQDASPYLGNGEFYDEYGTFDVAIEVPAGWLIGATGTLQNADEVLRPEARDRLAQALHSDEVVSVVTQADVAAGRATAPGSEGKLTWRFHADSVRDFAFATSNKYVWDAVGAETDFEGHPDGRAMIQNLYDPADSTWSEATLYAKHSIEFYSDYILPYPYSHATTALGPPQVGGMEYPMITFISGNQSSESLMSVVTHELSHFWMPMIVGSKEMAYAWMDEGLTTFNESLSRQAFYGNEDARTRDQNIYLQAARFGVEAPLMEHTDFVENEFGRSVAAYMKPATLMHSLRRMLGADVFDEAYRDYARTWAFKHPMPWDFFAIMEEHAGLDLDWFWQAWFYQIGTLDQALESVEMSDSGAIISVRNLGRAVMPVELHIEMADGSTTVMVWPAAAWAGTDLVTRTLAVSDDVSSVEIDPDHFYPDTDRSNNKWPAPASETSD